ncbi:MAG: sodium transporter, partial [Candidatus Acidiferrales bacterium]
NGTGALASLLTGFGLGALRFVMELMHKKSQFASPVARWLVEMNFLHYAILMFVVCAAVLIVVSYMTPAPDRRKLAGLTFATVDEKIETTGVEARKVALRKETARERRVNVAFSVLLFATVVGLWIYFR